MISQAPRVNCQPRKQAGRRTSTPTAAPPSSWLTAARRAAIRELSCVSLCGCCDSLLHHVQQRLGSTLFLDEDPTRLLDSFPLVERAFITPRVLAACILLTGRERSDLYPRERPAIWPALHILLPTSGPGCVAEPASNRFSRRPVPCCAPDLLLQIQSLLKKTRDRPELDNDPRMSRAIAYLSAAADTLEGTNGFCVEPSANR